MKTIFFHVGYQKTGTTALQAFFVCNVEQLKKNGILYPNAGRLRKAHHAFMAAFGAPGSGWVTPQHTKEQYAIELKAEFESSGCQNMIISSEDFSYLDDLTAISALFPGYCCKFVVYLRRQDNWIQSRLKHFIRSPYHGHTSWDIPEEILKHADYALKIASWAKSVGENNLIIRVYEKEQFIGGSIYTDFVQSIGCKGFTDFITPSDKFHPSLPPTALEVCRISNAMNLPFSIRRQIVRHLNNTFGEFYGCDREHELFSSQKRSSLLERYAVGNAWIARTFLQRKNGLLFLESLPMNKLDWEQPNLLDYETAVAIFLSLFASLSERINRLESHIKQSQIYNGTNSH